MKSLAETLPKTPAQMARMAARQPEKPRQTESERFVASVINHLFLQLQVVFPAAMAAFKPGAELDELRRQWTRALVEAGTTSPEQIAAGMKIARQQTRPFLPSPGQFVAWCRDGALGLPTLDEAEEEFKNYCRNRDLYSCPTQYPWRHDVLYWIVPDVHRQMRQYNYTAGEVRKSLDARLQKWAAKLARGETIPPRRVQIENKSRPPAYADTLGPGEAERLRRLALETIEHLKRHHAVAWSTCRRGGR